MDIGPLFLPIPVIAGAGGLFFGYLAGLLLVRQKHPHSFSLFWNIAIDALLAFLIVWKLTPLIFDAGNILKDPASILYRPGGTWGLLLGGLAVLIVFIIHLIKDKPAPSSFLKTSFILALLFAGGAALIYIPTRIITTPMKEQVIRGNIDAGRKTIQSLDMQTVAENRQPNWQADYLVVNVWATWCGPCRGELPEISEFYRNTKRRNVEIIAVNLTSTENSPNEVKTFVKEHNLQFPVLLDTEGRINGIFDIQAVPTTIIIGPQDTVTAVKRGVIDRMWLRRHTQ